MNENPSSQLRAEDGWRSPTSASPTDVEDSTFYNKNCTTKSRDNKENDTPNDLNKVNNTRNEENQSGQLQSSRSSDDMQDSKEEKQWVDVITGSINSFSKEYIGI